MKRTEYQSVVPKNLQKGYGRVIVKTRKTQRNEPCPCGSKHKDGTPIKFKNCCLEARK